MVTITTIHKDGSQFEQKFLSRTDEYKHAVDDIREKDDVEKVELQIGSRRVSNYWDEIPGGTRVFTSLNEFARFAKSLSF